MKRTSIALTVAEAATEIAIGQHRPPARALTAPTQQGGLK